MRDGWKEVKLGEVVKKIIGGGTPSKSEERYWNGDIFWCSVKDMSENKFLISETEDTITEEGLKNSSSNLIPKGTVITATRMGLGRAFINANDMAINQDLKAIFPNDKIDNKFLLFTILFNSAIKTLPLHSSQKLLIENSDEFQFELNLIPTFNFYQEILKYAGRVKILQPQKVRNHYVLLLNSGIELNS